MAEALDEALLGIEDWLDHAGEPGRRYELIDGRLVAMNPPKEWHGSHGSAPSLTGQA